MAMPTLIIRFLLGSGPDRSFLGDAVQFHVSLSLTRRACAAGRWGAKPAVPTLPPYLGNGHGQYAVHECQKAPSIYF
jgi:hypothetical protein